MDVEQQTKLFQPKAMSNLLQVELEEKARGLHEDITKHVCYSDLLPSCKRLGRCNNLN